jgi:hypothetical protein
MIDESRKIMHAPDIRVSATCVRVPVMVSHSAAVHIEMQEAMRPGAAQALLMDMPGVRVLDDPAQGQYPMPWDVTGEDNVFVGRIRRDESNVDYHNREKWLSLWIVSDNLRKGAALNSIQIAEELVDRECLKPGSTPRPKFRVGEPESLEECDRMEEYAYFRANVDELLPKYAGKFVALINRTIIDVDDEEQTLRKRVGVKYGNAPILTTQVTAGPRIINFTSRPTRSKYTEPDIVRL